MHTHRYHILAHTHTHIKLSIIGIRWGKIGIRFRLTTRPMPANSTAASASRKAPISFQPVSRLYLPPAMTTRKVMRVASSTMVAKESRKPLLRHMEQKNWSPRQSSSSGKWRHGGSSSDEQLWCSPRCLPYVAPELSAVTEYDIQYGVVMEAIVIAVVHTKAPRAMEYTIFRVIVPVFFFRFSFSVTLQTTVIIIFSLFFFLSFPRFLQQNYHKEVIIRLNEFPLRFVGAGAGACANAGVVGVGYWCWCWSWWSVVM